MTDRFVSPVAPPEGHVRELLTILSEEGAEIGELLGLIQVAVARAQVRTSKALRFGIEEVQPGQDLSNAIRLGREIGDFLEVLDRLIAAGVIPQDSIDDGRASKRRQLAKFLQTEAEGKEGKASIDGMIPITYGHDDRGNILLPNGAPFDGKPVLIRTASGLHVEAWWDHGRKVEATPVSPEDYEGWTWVCFDDAFQLDLDDAKAWSPLPAAGSNRRVAELTTALKGLRDAGRLAYEQGDFKNGNTDANGVIDEGEVRIAGPLGEALRKADIVLANEVSPWGDEPTYLVVPHNPCLAKLEEGEPFFVLLGRDAQAPEAIGRWVTLREMSRGPSRKTRDARRIAAEMQAFRLRRQIIHCSAEDAVAAWNTRPTEAAGGRDQIEAICRGP
jgi:hypothetical protein